MAGWKIISWEGNYSRQTEATDGKLRFPVPDVEKQLADIEAAVCRSTPDPIFNALRAVDALAGCSYGVEMNPHMLKSKRFEGPGQTKKIFLQIKGLYLLSNEFAARFSAFQAGRQYGPPQPDVSAQPVARESAWKRAVHFLTNYLSK